MKLFTGAAFGIAGLALLATAAAADSVTQKPFGMKDGKAVTLYTLTNSHGAQVSILNYGGIVQSLRVPDKHGKLGDVVLGFDSLARYQKDSPYFGALIGRYGNRIANGKFTLDGKEYKLFVNNGPNSLHGGKVGFDKKSGPRSRLRPKMESVWTCAMSPKTARKATLAISASMSFIHGPTTTL